MRRKSCQWSCDSGRTHRYGSVVNVPSGLLHVGGAAETAHAAGTVVGGLPHGAYGPPLAPHHSRSVGVVPRPRMLAGMDTTVSQPLRSVTSAAASEGGGGVRRDSSPSL